MSAQNLILNGIVAAFVATITFSLPATAQEAERIDRLFSQLQEADPADASRIAKEIELEWTKSGSPSADLLLKRGKDAFKAGDSQAAIEHFTALTDHAPDFAEGWHMRSLAYADVGLFGPAIADIERTLALEPRHYNAIASLGGIMSEIEKEDLAKEAFEAVLSIHPHHQDVIEALDYLESQIGGSEL